MTVSLSAFSLVIEVLATIAFTVSGVFAALEKKLDVFGVTIIAFITALGGGTVRDVLIGATPVAWMKDVNLLLIILGTVAITLLLRKHMGNLHQTLLLFDALGLGLFTVVGIRKGLAIDLSPGICVALGTITGCFGGVVRDILLNKIPTLFQKEIYATACIAGGVLYLILIRPFGEETAEVTAIITISLIRIIAYRRKWTLPPL
ncbi:trimeric intracellular cation channel family protein [Mucilaginibacter limnophilus]|uniref:Trimeric intracellular cation channel family protein n=1 Tax=Mucilaginibacter limnophilus TaxID=1932778 RepID=A0A437MWQ0_9SPHI|nr:trimeric intracellular cation channel family protein [Mucilaginibacter limnophilus]RVU02067.1 trimeric intracellular cation channel family protein [Mucilaginibacter limnophilus]